MEIPGFCGGMYKGRSFAIDGQECVNLYAENNGPFAKGEYALIGTPGKKLFTEVIGIKADFTYVVDSNSLLVTFTNTSIGSPTSYLWDFGDYTTSTDENPTRLYEAIGRYVVTLTVSNSMGTDSISYIIENHTDQEPTPSY
jgi:PKD repeat protein